jgi:hypothetical protein
VVEISNLLLLLRFFILDFRIVPTIWYFLFYKNAYTLQLDTLINIRFQYIVGIPFKEAKQYCNLYDNTSIITSIPKQIKYWTAYHRHEYLYWLKDNDDPVIHQGIYIYYLHYLSLVHIIFCV